MFIDVMLPVAPFFAALTTRGMHARMSVHRPLA
jgi:hypothetical protein